MRRITVGSVVATVAVAVVIGVLTLSPPSGLEMPAGSDKFSHLLAFAALVLPLAVVRPRWNVALFLLSTAYGASIELIQPYVGRSREMADFFADVIGILGGMLVGLLVRRLFPSLRTLTDGTRSGTS